MGRGSPRPRNRSEWGENKQTGQCSSCWLWHLLLHLVWEGAGAEQTQSNIQSVLYGAAGCVSVCLHVRGKDGLRGKMAEGREIPLVCLAWHKNLEENKWEVLISTYNVIVNKWHSDLFPSRKPHWRPGSSSARKEKSCWMQVFHVQRHQPYTTKTAKKK